jgi:hypothetical protein
MSLKGLVLLLSGVLLAAGLLVFFGVMDVALARWPVKTFRDRDRALVRMVPVDVTVDDLASRSRPDPRAFRGTRRIAPEERTVFRVRGRLENAHYESDGDLHMTIGDPRDPSRTLIAEIPKPLLSLGSGLARTFREERAEVDRHRPVRGQWIEVTGIGFFDYRSHTRSGGADNGIELHPVIALTFPKGP